MNEIIKIARSWLGTKFHHQGRKKHVGVDCIGFIVGVVKEMGFEVADRQDYPRQPRDGQLQLALLEYLQPCEIKIGAIALFKIDKQPQHVGIITDYDAGFGLIHAYANSRKVVEHRLNEVWQGRLVECYELPGNSKMN